MSSAHTTFFLFRVQARLAQVEAALPRLAKMVRHMLQLNPERRDSVEGYLAKWSAELFPPFFEPLHRILAPIMTWSKDHAVLHIKTCFLAALQHVLPSPSQKHRNVGPTAMCKGSVPGGVKAGLNIECSGTLAPSLTGSNNDDIKSGGFFAPCSVLSVVVAIADLLLG
jgi:hypothetical protein